MPWPRLLPSSLVTRVFLLYSSAMLLFVGLGVGLYINDTVKTTINDTQIEAEAVFALLVPTTAESAVIGDYDTIKRSLERIVRHPAFKSAQYIDLKGGKLQVDRKDASAHSAPAWLLERIQPQLDAINAMVSVGGRDYGVLRLHVWSEKVAVDIWSQARTALLLGLGSLLGGLVLVWFPLKQWLGKLDRIQAFGAELQQKGGQLSKVAEDDAPLELRQTFAVINRAAATLQMERAQAAVTLAAITDGVATTNAQGELVLVNPVLAGWLGRSMDQLLGQPIQGLLPQLHDMAQPAEAWHLQLQTAQGLRIMEVSRSAVALGDEALDLSETQALEQGHVYAFHDVTEPLALQQQLQQELAARATAMRAMRQLIESHPQPSGLGVSKATVSASSEIDVLVGLVGQMVQQLGRQSAQLGAIFALSPDGFVSFDAEGRVLFASSAFERLTGLQPTQVLGRSLVELQGLIQARCVANQAPIHLSELGEERLVISLAEPWNRVLELGLHQGQDQTISAVLHVHDVTHQVEVDRMKSEFLSTAAHELRTPMTSIHGFSELLVSGRLPPQRQAEALDKVHRQTQVMMHILNELLDISRLEARKGQDFEFEAVGLQSLVREVCEDFRPAEERTPPVLALCDEALKVWVDRYKLMQVLRNLLSNAYKYSPGGGNVWVRVRLLHDGQQTLAVMEVQDQGIGMSPEDLAHVTERFFRADKSGHILGTGLGMSIVKQILDLMGGRLQLASTLGEGTTVTVLLPLHQDPVMEPSA